MSSVITLRAHLLQGIKFALSGGLATVVDLTVFNMLLLFTSIDARVASIFSGPFGLATVFLMNKHFTFRGRQGNLSRQLLRFIVVYGVAYVLNFSLTALFITIGIGLFALPLTTLLANIAKLLAVACIALWNYAMLHFFVFKHAAADSHTSA